MSWAMSPREPGISASPPTPAPGSTAPCPTSARRPSTDSCRPTAGLKESPETQAGLLQRVITDESEQVTDREHHQSVAECHLLGRPLAEGRDEPGHAQVPVQQVMKHVHGVTVFA